MDEKNKKGLHCLLTKGENCVLDNKRADDRCQNKVAALMLENFNAVHLMLSQIHNFPPTRSVDSFVKLLLLSILQGFDRTDSPDDRLLNL